MKYKSWSQNEIDYIKHHSAGIPDKIVAEDLSRITGQSITSSMIRRQRRNLKIVKPKGRPKKETFSNPDSEESNEIRRTEPERGINISEYDVGVDQRNQVTFQ